MIHNTLRLTDNIKLFGLTQHNTIIHDTDTLNLLKNSSHKQYLLTKRDRFGLWNYRYFGRRKRKGSWLSQKAFGVLGTRSTRTIIYGKGRIGWTRNWIRSWWIRMVRGDRGQVPVILGTSNRNRIMNRNRVVRNRINWNRNRRRRRNRNGGLAATLPTLMGHMTRLLAAPAQAREGTGPRRMASFFANSTVARVPCTTDETKHV